MSTAARARAARLAVPVYSLALTLVVTAPLLAPGYLLLRDAVSTPRSYLSDAALGLTQSAPRAVPQDFLIAVATTVLDGGVLVKALLIAGVWSAGWGAARLAATLLPQSGLAGQCVAVTVAIWNPYVAERLLQGHWSLLVGYGALGWVAVAMLRLRACEPAVFALAFWVAVAGLTATGTILAAIVALVCVAAPGRRSRLICATAALGTAAVAALPWLVAAALTSSLSAYRAAGTPGVEAFAARAEPGLGTLGSLAGLGGIWNAEAAPGSRTTAFAALATLVLLAIVVIGLPLAVRQRAAVPLLVLAGAAVMVPTLMASGPGMVVVRTLADAVPGFGVIRDGQKWVALAMPGYGIAAAAAVPMLSRFRWRPPVVAVACCLVLIATLPDLAWGAWGRVRSVHYPQGWSAVAAAVNADPRTVAVLPADSMRQFDWAGTAPVLDPLPRWLRADVLTTGDLTISGHPVPGEGGRARQVQDLLLAGAAPRALADAGVGWVVAESGTPGNNGSAATTLAALPVVYSDGDLTLYRVGGDTVGATNGARSAVIAAHLVWLAMLIAGAGGLAVEQIRSRGLRSDR